MPLGALLGGIGGILGGNKAANGAMDAAGAQVGATDVAAHARTQAYNAAMGLDRQTLSQILATNRAQFQDSMGDVGRAYNYNANLNENAYRFSQQQLNPLIAQGSRARDAMMYNVGLGERPEGYAGFEGSPGYQWMVSQAEDAIRNQAAAGGSLASGATLKALTNYRTGAAAQDFGNYYNRLAGLAGSGDQARYASIGERNRFAANNAANRNNFVNNRVNLRSGYANAQNSARSGSLANQMNLLNMRGEAEARRATDAANAYASGRMGATAGQTQAMQAGFGIPGGMLSSGLQLAGGIAGMGGINGIGNALMNGTSLGSSFNFGGLWGG